MNKFLSLLLLTAAASLPLATARADEPTRLRRADSFVGVHFDFHAGADCETIGARTTPEMVQTIIDAVHPDYLQTDCKGHAGYCSYPTKVGNPAPGIVADGLKVWRDVTAKNGVALYVHYSGVWDNQAVARRPEWAVLDAAGNRSDRITSVFGGYKDGLLVPQLVELANEYGIDGAWIDGECWATQIDYSDRAKELFRAATGREAVPTAPDQDGWQDWANFNREGFRQYVRDYIAAVKKDAPQFQIASNWAYTDHMPEPVSAPVDFLSGDYSPNDSVNSARYSSRFIAGQGVPWDLMAWSFATQGDRTFKSGPQLCREAACVLSQGGGFQAYITQDRDGAVNLDKLPPVAEAARFCRKYQTLCQRSTPIAQVGLFCPTATHYRQTSEAGSSLFPPIHWQRPILNRLLEANYSVEILTEKSLLERGADFPVLVFYRATDWSPELTAKVGEYVRGGGKVVLIGNEPQDAARSLLDAGETNGLANRDDVWFLSETKLGNGSFVVFPTPVGSPQEFVDANGPIFGEFLAKAFETAFEKPLVQFAERKELDVSTRKTADGKTAICLVNVSGPHATQPVVDSIDPIENVELTLNLPQRPQTLRLEPSGVELPFVWENGAAKTTVPSVPIFEIIVVD